MGRMQAPRVVEALDLSEQVPAPLVPSGVDAVTAGQAASWVFDKIKERLPHFYPDGEGNTEVDEKDDGAYAADIVDGYYDDQGGKDKMTTLAEDVLDESFA